MTTLLRLRRRLWGRAGGVNMEYVILAVLVAAAVMLAVAYFGRTIAKMFLTSSEAVTLEHTKAQSNLNKRRPELDIDRKTAKKYHDSMHK
ncbi:MAG: hypothetical protein KAH23_00175 [Kiritimatiellae bacterium]|nr:hypothetical protein [Kiritimatiellia bacterium]